MAWGREGHINALEKRIREIADSLTQVRKELGSLDRLRGDLDGLVESLKEVEKEIGRQQEKRD